MAVQKSIAKERKKGKKKRKEERRKLERKKDQKQLNRTSKKPFGSNINFHPWLHLMANVWF